MGVLNMPLIDLVSNNDKKFFLVSGQGYPNERLTHRDTNLGELADKKFYKEVIGVGSVGEIPALDQNSYNFVCVTVRPGEEHKAFEAYFWLTDNNRFGEKTHWGLFCESKVLQSRFEKDPKLQTLSEKLKRVELE
jgi:hypothetical protein